MNLTELAVKTVYWFFLYGFIGWGVEVVYAAVKTHKLVNRGFLCGPICPIYGFGMVGLIYSVSLIPLPDSGSMSAVAIFFIGMILTTAIELVGGWALFKIYHIRWWDYSNMKFNLGGYICPQFSLLWGLGSVLMIKVIHPLLARGSSPMPFNIMLIVDVVLLVLFGPHIPQALTLLQRLYLPVVFLRCLPASQVLKMLKALLTPCSSWQYLRSALPPWIPQPVLLATCSKNFGFQPVRPWSRFLALVSFSRTPTLQLLSQ